MRIPSSFMDVYGLQPVRDALVLAQCKLCKKTLRVSAFANHLEVCRKATPSSAATAAVVAPAPVSNQQLPGEAEIPEQQQMASVKVAVQAMGAPSVPATTPAPTLAPIAPAAPVNQPPLSSTRIGLGSSVGKNRAPPTPPKLMKLKPSQKRKKKQQQQQEDGEEEGDFDADDGNEHDEEAAVAEAEEGEQVRSDYRVTIGRKGPATQGARAFGEGDRREPRKEISVLEIRADKSDSSNKVTIMVQAATPVLTRAHRASSAVSAAPLASRRWTRRNKLTGLSLSFKIRSDECASDGEDDDDDEDDEEEEHYEGGDLSQGWAYTTQRRKSVPPRASDTEDYGAKRKSGAPPVINNVSAKRMALGE